MNNYYVADCQVCQGTLEVLKRVSDQKLFIVCDECSLVWTDIVSAINNIGGKRENVGQCVSASKAEIKAAGWYGYAEAYENGISSYEAKRKAAQSDIIGVIPFSPARDAPLSQVRAVG